MDIELVKISFDEIYPIWSIMLWPYRKTAIEPISIIQCNLSYDPDILKYTPTFHACKINGRIVGVNSGVKTANGVYRSRGLFVDPAYRGLGLSKHLLTGTEEQGIQENCNIIWTLPRQSSMPAYESAGYIQISDYFIDNMEFGPNCVAIKYLTKLQSE